MSSEQERWQVRIAPGEIKLLTLEQIDDLFRLEMIDGDTLLRQEGEEDWMRLRVVAGLDEDDDAGEAAPVAAPEPAPARVVRSAPPPPPSARSAPPSARSAPPPVPSRPVPSAPPPPVQSAPPPPPPVQSARPPVQSAWPPAVQSAPPPVVRSAAPPPPPPPPPVAPPSERAPFSPSPSFIPPAPSLRGAGAPPPPPPIVHAPVPAFAPPAPSVAPPPVAFPAPAGLAAPTRASRAETLIIAAAALLGLLVVLHRNGALAALFEGAGQGRAYASLEAALGGPSSATPRGVEALLSKSELAGAATPSPKP